MYSVWRATREEWEAWAVTRLDDGTSRPASEQELLDRQVAVAGVDEEEGEVYFQVGKVEWKRGDFPGRPLTAGGPEARFRSLSRKAREVCGRAAAAGRAQPLSGAARAMPHLALHRWLGEPGS